MRAEEFDDEFDRGADITSELDLAEARRPGEVEGTRDSGTKPPSYGG